MMPDERTNRYWFSLGRLIFPLLFVLAVGCRQRRYAEVEPGVYYRTSSLGDMPNTSDGVSVSLVAGTRNVGKFIGTFDDIGHGRYMLLSLDSYDADGSSPDMNVYSMGYITRYRIQPWLADVDVILSAGPVIGYGSVDGADDWIGAGLRFEFGLGTHHDDHPLSAWLSIVGNGWLAEGGGEAANLSIGLVISWRARMGTDAK